MKTTIDIEIKPFVVPNFVVQILPVGKKDDGWKPSEGIPLSELSSETLYKLCKDFTDDVFQKAGKPQPPKAA